MKKILTMLFIISALCCLLAVSVSAEETDPYASYYDKVYTAIDGTPLALYEKEGDAYYPLAWFYDSAADIYEAFRVGTEVIFAVSGGTTQIPSGVDFRENAEVIFSDEAKTYTLQNLILVNLQGVKTNMFSGSWSKLPIQAIYCNVGFCYVNGGTFTGNTTLTVFDIPKAHNAKSATICGAFSRCTNLKEIYIPKSVCVLTSAFEYSGLEKVEFAPDYEPKGVFDWQTSAGKSYWFGSCTSLKTVILPANSSTHNYLGANTFFKCTSLEEIIIPSCITRIDSKAFAECTALQKVLFVGNYEQVTALLENTDLANNAPLVSIMGENRANLISYADYQGKDGSGMYFVYNYSYCDAYNAGQHSFTGISTMKPITSYFAQIVFADTCTTCGVDVIDESKTIAAIFTYYGYSCTEEAIGGSYSMSQFYGIDKEALGAYTEFTGKTFEYGLIASGVSDPFKYVEGELTVDEKAVVKDSETFVHEFFGIKINGMSGENLKKAIVFCAYVIDDGNVFYLDNDTTVTEISGISYDTVYATLNGGSNSEEEE